MDGELRTEVEDFAKAMETTLREHDDRVGWKNSDLDYLFNRLLMEVAELHAAMSLCYPIADIRIAAVKHAAVKHECTDIANFAMMIWDIID